MTSEEKIQVYLLATPEVRIAFGFQPGIATRYNEDISFQLESVKPYVETSLNPDPTVRDVLVVATPSEGDGGIVGIVDISKNTNDFPIKFNPMTNPNIRDIGSYSSTLEAYLKKNTDANRIVVTRSEVANEVKRQIIEVMSDSSILLKTYGVPDPDAKLFREI